jgi:hypothetical protein
MLRNVELREIEGFMSSLIYNSEENTEIRQIVDRVFPKEGENETIKRDLIMKIGNMNRVLPPHQKI